MDKRTPYGERLGFPPTDRSLTIVMVRVREKLMTPVRTMLAGINLTEQQWRVMRVLAEKGDLDSTSLANSAALMLPSLTRITQTLLDKGYVVRHTDPADRRRHIVGLTDAGFQVLRENRDKSKAISKKIRETVGEERYERLVQQLREVDTILS